MVLNVKTQILVSFTKESRLKKRLQEVDRLIGEATRPSAVRFVERCGGTTIIGLLPYLRLKMGPIEHFMKKYCSSN